MTFHDRLPVFSLLHISNKNINLYYFNVINITIVIIDVCSGNSSSSSSSEAIYEYY
jgi:hypothetical protein